MAYANHTAGTVDTKGDCDTRTCAYGSACYTNIFAFTIHELSTQLIPLIPQYENKH